MDRQKIYALRDELRARAIQLWEMLLVRLKSWREEAMADTIRPQRAAPDSLEGHLGIEHVQGLLATAADKMLRHSLPVLSDQRVLELGEGAGRFAALLTEHGAREVIATEIGPLGLAPVADVAKHVRVVRATTLRLPYRDGTFDFVVANLLSLYQGETVAVLKELSRVLTPGGAVIALDFHPFAAFARRGTVRVRPTETSTRGLGDYYKAARQAGLRVQEVKEGFIDETLRPQFTTPEQKQAYRTFRDKPLVLAMIARKGVGG